MVVANMNGKTAENIRDSINLTKSMGSESILGLMVENILVNGSIARDMAKERSSMLTVARKWGSGTMIKE